MKRFSLWLQERVEQVLIGLMVIGTVASIAYLAMKPPRQCRETVADPGTPCEWRSGVHRQRTKLEIRGAVAICTCKPDE